MGSTQDLCREDCFIGSDPPTTNTQPFAKTSSKTCAEHVRFCIELESATLLGCIILYLIMFMPILLILALGFLWIPQIIKNMRNQARKAPSLPFIIIISIEHIYVPVFANLVENNVMENEPKMWVAIVLISVIVVEITVLILQKLKGALYLVPKKWRPYRYDYYRSISPKYAEPTSQYNDCAICLENVTVMQSLIGQERKKQKGYYETPCAHSFHIECLTRWMMTRSICPICRSYLPPLSDA
eukprot:TRINITY_DN8981_c0_g1_i1.p1 TRINITY_DN8981_c0_g1~~TRINITY_DN8981_c0_g1_i1.p1  ORF type:complete len:242 (+),score=6.88 TRINITY_DN8981_c0_g1_i1:38-763(+)